MKDEWTARKWESPSDWVALVPGRILDFGGRVCGVVNGLCHGLTDGNGWTARKWDSLRSGWACPCGGFWVLAGVSVGRNHPRMKNHEHLHSLAPPARAGVRQVQV